MSRHVNSKYSFHGVRYFPQGFPRLTDSLPVFCTVRVRSGHRGRHYCTCDREIGRCVKCVFKCNLLYIVNTLWATQYSALVILIVILRWSTTTSVNGRQTHTPSQKYRTGMGIHSYHYFDVRSKLFAQFMIDFRDKIEDT